MSFVFNIDMCFANTMSFSDDDGDDYDDEPCAVDSEDNDDEFSAYDHAYDQAEGNMGVGSYWIDPWLRVTDFDHACFGSIHAIQDLVLRGFDINQRDRNGRTLLHFAALNGNIYRVRDLLALNADPSICDNNGNRPQQVTNKPQILVDLSDAIEKRYLRAGAFVN